MENGVNQVAQHDPAGYVALGWCIDIENVPLFAIT